MNQSQPAHYKNPIDRKKIAVCLAIAITVFLGCTFLSAGIAKADTRAQAKLPTVTLEINGVSLKTELASTGQQRFMGLSFREKLAEDEAMLFVYPHEQQLNFTMRNTLLPLSIAFISKDMVINEIHQMPVGPNQLFPSKRPAQFALEVNQGWFKRNKVGVGSTIRMKTE